MKFKNTKALQALQCHEYACAQELFRSNARLTPCCVTLNNLAVYYLDYGMTLSNNKHVSAWKIGARILKKATLLESGFISLANYAVALAEDGQFKDANYFFRSAISNGDSRPLTYYNYASCLFRCEEYEEASRIMGMALAPSSVETILQNGGDHPLLFLAFSHLYTERHQESHQIFSSYCAQKDGICHYNIFKYYFQSNQYECALNMVENLLEEWLLTDEILSMMEICIQQASMNNSKAVALRKQMASAASDRIARQHSVSDIHYLPPMISCYAFYE